MKSYLKYYGFLLWQTVKPVAYVVFTMYVITKAFALMTAASSLSVVIGMFVLCFWGVVSYEFFNGDRRKYKNEESCN